MLVPKKLLLALVSLLLMFIHNCTDKPNNVHFSGCIYHQILLYGMCKYLAGPDAIFSACLCLALLTAVMVKSLKMFVLISRSEKCWFAQDVRADIRKCLFHTPAIVIQS